MKKDKLSLLVELFFTFFKLGSISFGGGYAMISLIEREVVDEKGWVDKEKIIDIFAVAGSLPGAIAINASALVGYSIAGPMGALSAMLGNLTPSVLIVITLSILFTKFSTNPIVQAAFNGIRPAITGLILYAAYKIGKTALTDKTCVFISIIAFCGIIFFELHPILIIIFGAVSGIVIVSVRAASAVKVNSKDEVKGGK